MNRFDKSNVDIYSEEIMAEINMPSIKMPNEIQVVFDTLLDRTKLKTLSPRDLSEYMILLSAFCMTLNITENKINALCNWCETNIKNIVGKNLDNVNGYGFNEKDAKIRASDSHAIELENVKLEAQVKLDSIKFLANRVQYIADSIKSLMFEKSKERKML